MISCGQGSQCEGEETTTQQPCPQLYQTHQHSSILCQLWAELETLQEEEQQGLTVAPLSPVNCLYSNYSEGADLLCELYCKVELYKGLQCRPLCPEVYRRNNESALLCQLWSELQDNDSMTHQPTLSPVECPHEDNQSGALICELWCQVAATQGSQCVSCPQKYRNDTASELLCDLWIDLEMTNFSIDAGDLATPAPLQNMTCKYSNHPTSSENLCNLWCKLQLGMRSM